MRVVATSHTEGFADRSGSSDSDWIISLTDPGWMFGGNVLRGPHADTEAANFWQRQFKAEQGSAPNQPAHIVEAQAG